MAGGCWGSGRRSVVMGSGCLRLDIQDTHSEATIKVRVSDKRGPDMTCIP